MGRRRVVDCSASINQEDSLPQEILRFLAIHVGPSMPDSNFNLLALMGEMGFE
jgi:hypothetical protein